MKQIFFDNQCNAVNLKHKPIQRHLCNVLVRKWTCLSYDKLHTEMNKIYKPLHYKSKQLSNSIWSENIITKYCPDLSKKICKYQILEHG